MPESPNRGVRFANACARAAVSKQLLLNHSVIFFGPAPLPMRSGRGQGDFVLQAISEIVQAEPTFSSQLGPQYEVISEFASKTDRHFKSSLTAKRWR